MQFVLSLAIYLLAFCFSFSPYLGSGVFSHRLHSLETQFQSQASPCGIYGEQSVSGTVFSSKYFHFVLSISFQQCCTGIY